MKEVLPFIKKYKKDVTKQNKKSIFREREKKENERMNERMNE